MSRARPLSERLWARVDAREPLGCWLWTGTPNQAGGYGVIRADGRGPMLRAHRVAYVEAHGAIPAGLHVLHDCDRPLCVNPLHLYAGTHRENMLDMATRRRRRGKGAQRGEANPGAKLTRAEVDAIRDASLPLTVLATRYGVAVATIGRIKRGDTWRL